MPSLGDTPSEQGSARRSWDGSVRVSGKENRDRLQPHALSDATAIPDRCSAAWCLAQRKQEKCDPDAATIERWTCRSSLAV